DSELERNRPRRQQVLDEIRVGGRSGVLTRRRLALQLVGSDIDRADGPVAGTVIGTDGVDDGPVVTGVDRGTAERLGEVPGSGIRELRVGSPVGVGQPDVAGRAEEKVVALCDAGVARDVETASALKDVVSEPPGVARVKLHVA